MAAQIRLTKELKEVAKKDVDAGVQAIQVGGSERHLLGTIIGSQGTPYEGGVFDIDIVIPVQYPFEPPKMKFITKIWHPNISSQTGAICLVRHNATVLLIFFSCGYLPHSEPSFYICSLNLFTSNRTF